MKYLEAVARVIMLNDRGVVPDRRDAIGATGGKRWLCRLLKNFKKQVEN